MKTWQVETSFNQSLLRQTLSSLHYLPAHAMENCIVAFMSISPHVKPQEKQGTAW